jgi:hypothetical protein
MSEQLPAEMTLEQPNPNSASLWESTVATLPLWDEIPTAPVCGMKAGIQGKSFVRGTAIPCPFGPIKTIPPALALFTISACKARPSSPSSANPAEMTRPALTPLLTQSEMESTMALAGIVKMARSTSPGMEDTVGKALSLWTSSSFGFTG